MPRLILVRHGQSTWNLQNRFTGWVDVSLSRQGMAEAEKAGQSLADEHFEVAFTSALQRAQDTLYEILKQNRHCEQYVRVHEQNQKWYENFTPAAGDQSELKIYMSEKLNERYYGDLQGLNKNLASQQYGAEQVHQWRRSYSTPPPNGESLEMTAARVLPYYQQHIAVQLRTKRTVLVTAHGNSLRALIMHIESLSSAAIVQKEIPTGTPLVYEFTSELQLRECSIIDADTKIMGKNYLDQI
jgi:2,3-bisphosphoglycerate-dependent phosphoglycerate mutase